MTASENRPVQLGSMDANIPLLAIEAANELDELIERRPTGLDAVEQLANILKRSFQLELSSASEHRFLDSGTVAVFSGAIDDLGARQEVTTLDDLAKRAMQIVRTLEASASRKDFQELENMRNFCIALSHSAVAHQESVFDMAPSNPLRA